MSLSRRVVIGVIAVAVVLLVTNLVLAGQVRAFVLGRVDDQLQRVAVPAAGITVTGPPAGPPLQGGAARTPTRGLTELFVALADTNGRITDRLGVDLSTRPLPALEPRDVRAHSGEIGRLKPFSVHAETGDGSWRVVAVRAPNGQIVVLASSLDDATATTRRMLVVQGVGSAGVLLALALVAWWVLRLGIRPLDEMVETAQAIAGGDLSRRVERDDDATEAGRLGAAINVMLQEIEDALDQRAASEANVRRFAADASHELRTPLTSIQGYAELWRQGGLRDDASLADAMRRIEQEAARMGVLVDDLLLLAHLDQGRPLERHAIRLDVLVTDAVTDAKAVEPDRPIELQATPVTLHGDEARLRQVVANLLANARTHTVPGTLVAVHVTQSDGWARLTVRDEGPGLSPATAARVFERFYRADQARSRATGGAGLGLSIVAAVAEAHGGRASVESTPGSGSSFVVDLPLN